jgi:hypothetical protein
MKGKVKVIIRNPDGSIAEQREGCNIVTHAIDDILANNILGCVDYTKIYPLWSRWFSGVLCFENAFATPLDADDYFVPDDSLNPAVAHAGDVTPDDFADDPTRGEPNTHVQIVSPTQVRQTWEWGPTQPGSSITVGAIALCHKDLGNAGTGRNSNAFKAFSPFDIVSIGLANTQCSFNNPDLVFAQYDDTHGLYFHIGEEGDFYDLHSKFQTSYITIKFRKMGFAKFGLYETAVASDEFDEYLTVDLGPGNYLYAQPSFFYDKANKKLHLFTNITGIGQYDSLQYSTSTIKHYTITIPSITGTPTVDVETLNTGRSDLAPLSMDYYMSSAQWYHSRPNFQVIAHAYYNNTDYWYFPCSDSVDISAQLQNVKGFVFIGGGTTTYIPLNDVQGNARCAMSGPGLTPVLMSGRVLNGRSGYTCQDQFGVSDMRRAQLWPFATPEAVSSFLMPSGTGNVYEAGRYIAINKFLMTTKFNLPGGPVTKAPGQSMTIVYELEGD